VVRQGKGMLSGHPMIQRCYMVESWLGFDDGRSSSACTVTPTFTRPRSSRMWCGKHNLSCSWTQKQM